MAETSHDIISVKVKARTSKFTENIAMHNGDPYCVRVFTVKTVPRGAVEPGELSVDVWNNENRVDYNTYIEFVTPNTNYTLAKFCLRDELWINGAESIMKLPIRPNGSYKKRKYLKQDALVLYRDKDSSPFKLDCFGNAYYPLDITANRVPAPYSLRSGGPNDSIDLTRDSPERDDQAYRRDVSIDRRGPARHDSVVMPSHTIRASNFGDKAGAEGDASFSSKSLTVPPKASLFASRRRPIAKFPGPPTGSATNLDPQFLPPRSWPSLSSVTRLCSLTDGRKLRPSRSSLASRGRRF